MTALSFAMVLVLASRFHDEQEILGCEYFKLILKLRAAFLTLNQFILAGYVLKVLLEWRTQRKNYSNVVSFAVNFATLCCSLIQVSAISGMILAIFFLIRYMCCQAPRSRPDLRIPALHARHKIGRYIKLSVELTVAASIYGIDKTKVQFVHFLFL